MLSQPVPAASGPSRRAVLRSAAVASGAGIPLLLSACKGAQALGSPPPPSASVRRLRSAISAEELMVARYTAALTTPATPAVAAALTAVRAEHEQHLSQLKSRLVEPAVDRSAPAAASPRISDSLPDLEAAEQAASGYLIGLLGGLPPSLAQLLASIAAAEATHVPYLRAAGGRR